MVENDTSLEQAGFAAEGFQRLDGADLGELALRRLAVEPGEEARHGGAVAPVRLARAFDLDRVLHRLEQRDRVRAFADLAAGAGHDPRQRVGGGREIEAHGLAGLAERGERAGEIAGRAHVGKLLEPMAHVVRELAAVDEQRRAALARDDGEGERQRRVRDIGAADVEGPGDRVRIGHDERVGLELGDLGPDGRELGLGGLAGKTDVVQRHRAERRGRAVVPQFVDRVGLDRRPALAPALAQARASFSAPSTVCSHGS